MRVFAVAALLATAIAACDGGDDNGESDGTADPAGLELTPATRAYLEGARDAQREFERRNRRFFALATRQYSSADAFLDALADAGAGRAFAAVRSAAIELDPPPELRDGHRRWLAVLDEAVRLDRRIGRAIRSGDIVGFEANNLRLGLASGDALAEMPVELAEVISGPGLRRVVTASLDAGVPAAETTGAPELFEALREFNLRSQEYVVDPPPPVENQVLAQTAREVGEEVLAPISDGQRSVQSIEVGELLGDDHERVVRYFDELVETHEEIVAAARAGDATATRAAIDRAKALYCEVDAELSDTAKPVTDVYFGELGGRDQIC